jgi:hypothetical protein
MQDGVGSDIDSEFDGLEAEMDAEDEAVAAAPAAKTVTSFSGLGGLIAEIEVEEAAAAPSEKRMKLSKQEKHAESIVQAQTDRMQQIIKSNATVMQWCRRDESKKSTSFTVVVRHGSYKEASSLPLSPPGLNDSFRPGLGGFWPRVGAAGASDDQGDVSIVSSTCDCVANVQKTLDVDLAEKQQAVDAFILEDDSDIETGFDSRL